MRLKMLFLLLLSLYLLGGEHDFDFNYWSEGGYKFAIGPITVAQAKQCIINWAGRTNLQIELAPIYRWETPYCGRAPAFTIGGPGDSPLPQLTTWYAFGVEDPNPDHKYTGTVYVDSYTGVVKGIHHSSFQSRDSGNISDMLSPQQVIQLAREYITSYFPDIPLDAFELDPPDELSEDGSTWKSYTDFLFFAFRKKLYIPDGRPVWVTFQEVYVGMDSVTGELCDILCCYEPIEISYIPSLTNEQLAQAVVSYLYGLGASVVEIHQLNYGKDNDWWLARQEPYGQQRLGTNIEFYMEGVPGLANGIYIGMVDGHTGEIYATVIGVPPIGFPKTSSAKPAILSILFNGLKRGTKLAPIIKGGKVYIYVEDIKRMGFRLEKRKNTYIASYKGERAILEDKEVIKRGDRDFINGEALGKINGVIARYNKKLNQFHIVVLNEKAYAKGKQDRAKLKKVSSLFPLLVLILACATVEYALGKVRRKLI